MKERVALTRIRHGAGKARYDWPAGMRFTCDDAVAAELDAHRPQIVRDPRRDPGDSGPVSEAVQAHLATVAERATRSPNTTKEKPPVDDEPEL